MSQAQQGTPPKQRRGSFLSDKQVTEASKRGRLVTFRFLKTQPMHETAGYVVGKDDYHWLVACPIRRPGGTAPGEDPISVQLVHKSADLILLDSKETLSSLNPNIQESIKKMGSSFWGSQDEG